MRRCWSAALATVLLGALLSACLEQDTAEPSGEDWKVIHENLLKADPSPQHKVNADLEGNVTYLGADVDKSTIKPGEPFTITHYWKVQKAVPGWRLFVHVSDPDNTHFINADHQAIGGRYPVSLWKPGDIIRDTQTVTLPANWSKARVNIYTGLWQGDRRMTPKGPSDGDKRIIALSLPVNVTAHAAGAGEKKLIAVFTDKPVKVDGQLNDPVWKNAPTSDEFVDSMTGAKVGPATHVKAAWDAKYLYIAFDNQDKDVWSTLKTRDAKLWTEEAVEMFIDANNDQKDYIELQVNPLGTLFDSYLAGYRKNHDAWNSDLTAGVSVQGTLNQRKDVDKGWTVELAIPLAQAKGESKAVLALPKVGSTWRVNFFRLDKPEKQNQQALAWSPPLLPDFHRLDRFGTLVFADNQGHVPAPQAAVPEPAKSGNVVHLKTKPNVRGITAQPLKSSESTQKSAKP